MNDRRKQEGVTVESLGSRGTWLLQPTKSERASKFFFFLGNRGLFQDNVPLLVLALRLQSACVNVLLGEEG